MSSSTIPEARLLFREAFEKLEKIVNDTNAQHVTAFQNADFDDVYSACREIEESLEDYQHDFSESKYLHRAEWLERKMRVLRFKVEAKKRQEQPPTLAHFDNEKSAARLANEDLELQQTQPGQACTIL